MFDSEAKSQIANYSKRGRPCRWAACQVFIDTVILSGALVSKKYIHVRKNTHAPQDWGMMQFDLIA